MLFGASGLWRLFAVDLGMLEKLCPHLRKILRVKDCLHQTGHGQVWCTTMTPSAPAAIAALLWAQPFSICRMAGSTIMGRWVAVDQGHCTDINRVTGIGFKGSYAALTEDDLPVAAFRTYSAAAAILQ